MKLLRHLLIVVLLFCAVAMQAQTQLFTKVFGGQSYDEGIASFRSLDRGYMLIGNSSSYGNGQSDIWLIKLDSNGNFLWHKTYGSSQTEKVVAAIKVGADRFYLFGYTDQNQAQSYDALLLCVDQNGLLYFQKTYGGTDWDFGNAIAQEKDSTIVLGIQTQSYGLANANIQMLRINLNGDSLFSQVLLSTNTDKAYQIHCVGTSTFLCGTTKTNFTAGNNALLMRLDSNFQLVWRRDLIKSSESALYSFVLNSDTSITAVGFIRDTLLGHREQWMLKYSMNGIELWNHINFQGKDCYLADIQRRMDGKYLLTGTTTNWTNGGEDFHITLFTQDGWFIYGRSMGLYDGDIPNSSSLDLSDNSLTISGIQESRLMPRSSFYLVRLDSNLNADTAHQYYPLSGFAEVSNFSNLRLYPNPCNDKITIQLTDKGITFECCLRDAFGRVLIPTKEYYGSATLNLSSLSKGFYLLEIKSADKTSVQKVLRN